MRNHSFGVAGYSGEYHDVSRTERGAKNYATRNGYTRVYIRYDAGYHIDLIAIKQGKRWKNVK